MTTVRVSSLFASSAGATVRVAAISAISTPQSTIRITSLFADGVLVSGGAGPDRTAEPGELVTLIGTGSGSGTWTQTAGTPTVSILTTGTNTARYTAPRLRLGATLTFRYTVTDGVTTVTDDTVHTVYPHQDWQLVAGVLVPEIPYIVVPLSQPVSSDPTPPVPVGALLFMDHFDGAANTLPDSTKWGFEANGVNGFTGRNGELQYYTNGSLNNAFVDGSSNLNVVLRAESIGGKAYSSASLLTDGKFAFTGGFIEFRAKLPAGSGVWPALWCVGAGTWPGTGEIDVLEAVNSDQLATSNVHGGPTHWSNYGDTALVRSPAAYHVFAANVLPDRIVFYLDGAAYHTVLASSVPSGQTWPFNTSPQDVRINLAMGGSFPGTPNGTAALPLTLLVDYVKVWANP